VRARAMAVFMLVYMGTWTAGSAFWGYVGRPAGYTHFFDCGSYWHGRLSNLGFDFAFCLIRLWILELGTTGANRCWLET